MATTFKQILAWILIVCGLFIVFSDIIFSYFYFSAQKQFPQVFHNQQTAAQTLSQGTSAEDQVGEMVKEQIKEMMPEDSVTQLLNIVSWILFASFILFAGGKLVGIGTDFLREE
jgi:hypothetical protein